MPLGLSFKTHLTHSCFYSPCHTTSRRHLSTSPTDHFNATSLCYDQFPPNFTFLLPVPDFLKNKRQLQTGVCFIHKQEAGSAQPATCKPTLHLYPVTFHAAYIHLKSFYYVSLNLILKLTASQPPLL